jgi:hypothetical protein
VAGALPAPPQHLGLLRQAQRLAHLAGLRGFALFLL